MRFSIDVPEDIELRIGSWNLAWEIESQLWAILGRKWSDEDLAKCRWLAGPLPTFSLSLEFNDEVTPGLVHWFQFYLVPAGPFALRLQNAIYNHTGKWDEPPEGERDWGGFYTPE